MFFGLLIVSTIGIIAQTFSVFDVDASGYPTVKAKFYAFDAGGNQQTNFSTADFFVKEDGINRTLTNVSCPSPQPPTPISSVLVMDVSGSMCGTPLEMEKTLATQWVNMLNLGQSECGITSFSDDSYINCDLTTKRTTLLNKINTLTCMNGTDYDEAFLNQYTGAIQIAKAGKNHKKVIVFLSDGQPNYTPQTSRIIQEANDNGIIVYSVILDMDVPQCIKDITSQTGGLYFDNVKTKEEAEEIYRKILMLATGNDPCSIEWTSDFSCNAGYRTAIFNWNNLSSTVSYPTPNKSIAYLEIKPQSIRFSNVPPGAIKDTTITITARNADFNVNNIIINNLKFSIAPTNFNLNEGESKNITVSFTPTDSSYSFGRFEVQTDKCNAFLFASGGFTGKKINNPTLKLTHPNGGETFLAGSDTVITWEGVLPSDTVSLEYSLDSGKTWKLITDKATGLKYGWEHIPNIVSNKCLLKVRQLDIIIIDKVNDKIMIPTSNITDIAWSPTDSLLATSCTDSTIKIWDPINGKLIRTLRGHIASVNTVSWSPLGNKIASGGGHNDEMIKIWDPYSGICLRTIRTTEEINSIDWNSTGDRIACAQGDWWGAPDYVITIWNVNNGNNISTSEWCYAPVISISWNKENDIIVSGDVNYNIKFWDSKTNKLLKQIHDSSSVYSVSWSPYGNRILSSIGEYIKIWDTTGKCLIRVFQGIQQSVYSVSWSPNGDKIVCGGSFWSIDIRDSWTGLLIHELETEHTSLVTSVKWNNFGDRIACGTSPDPYWADNGRKLIIWFVGGHYLQEDISDTFFSILKPLATSKNIDMNKHLVGSLKDSIIIKFLQNTGTFPIRIDSISISGTDPSQFSVVSGIPPYVIDAGQSKAVEFRFQPTSVGIKTANILIYTQADTIIQTITGEGIQQQLQIETQILDFGTIPVGNDTTIADTALIKNISSTPITITNTLQLPPDIAQFEIVNGGGSFNLSPGESRKLTLRFKPVYGGRTTGRLGFEYNGVGSPAEVILYGEGIGGLVFIPDDSANVGETRNLQVMLGKVKPEGIASVASKYKAKLRFENSVLFPTTNVNLKRVNDSIEVEIESNISNSQNLYQLRVIAGLGRVGETSLDILEFNLYDINNNPVDYNFDYQSGNFKILGICPEGGKRLLNPEGDVQLFSINPNPASEAVDIEIELIENGRTQLILSNIFGERIQTLLDGNPELGRQTISFSTQDIPTGTYFVILKTPTIIKTQRIEVMK